MSRRSRIPTEPRIARLIIVWLTPDELKAQIEGDLREGYRYRREINGGWRAWIWYWRQLFSLDVLALRREVKMRRGRHQRSEVAMTARGWLSDIRYAVRAMKKNPGFTSVVLATLALGIGANTAVFSVVNSVLLRPLPYPESEQLAMVFRSVPRFGFTHSTVSFPDFNDWRAETTSFTSLGAYGYTTLTYMGGEGAERWTGYSVTADLLTLLQVPPAVGRIFTPDDDVPGADRVILLSFGLWQARFGGDMGVVGTRLALDENLHTVVGIMPADFSFPSQSTSFWIPLRGDAERMERDSNYLSVLGRLAPGVTVKHAQVEMERIAGRIDATAPRANVGYGILVEGRHAFVVSNAQTALLVFLGAVALVLIIACANVANLMLARGMTRRNEIAVRTALGAARSRIVRQLLTESAVLGVVGGILGLGLAAALLRMLVTLGAGQVPRLGGVGIDPTALGFTAFVSVAAGIAFGTVPAWLGSRSDLQASLKEGGRGAGVGRLGRRVQHSFVVAQLTLAVVLTTGAALLVNSFVRLTSVEPGFDPENVIAARVSPPRPEPPPMGVMSEEEMMAMRQSVMQTQGLFFDELLQRSRSLPGVTSAGLAFILPFSGSSFSRVVLPEGMEVDDRERPVIHGNIIAGDYFTTMGISLLRGRGFTDADAQSSPAVLIANETMSEAFWPGEDPIGKRIRIGDGDGPWTTVIGVVADVQQLSLAEEQQPVYYRPLSQVGWPDRMYVAVRTRISPTDLVAGLRREVWAIDSRVTITNVSSASELIAESVAEPRFRTIVLSTFGVFALLLAVVGIYGVMAYTVGDRTREIGIRMALGAHQGNIVKLVLSTGLGLTAIGVGFGVLAALGLTRFIESMLFGLAAHDVVTFGVVALGLGGVSLLATYLPARRAARIDPLKSLRYE